MKRKTKNMNWTYVSYPCLQQWRRSKHLTKEANNGDIRITKMRGFKDMEDFKCVCAGNTTEVGMGDDLGLLTERKPGRLWRHGQHAHHVQHQQQVWHHNQVIL